MDLFLPSEAKEQLPGHKKMIDSPLPESWFIKLNPDQYVNKLDGVGPVDNRPSTD